MTEENINETNEEVIEIDNLEDLQELVVGSENDKLPPIEIDMEDYNLDEFNRGLSDTSYMAGVITALMNTGVTESFVLDYILNKETIAYNLKAAEINKETSIEVSKNQKSAMEKQEL